jgi:hypothetical protein
MLARRGKRLFGSLGEHSLSPLDGRYKAKILPLLEHFSEAAFFKYRIVTEVEWIKHLARKQILVLGPGSSLAEFGGKASLTGSRPRPNLRGPGLLRQDQGGTLTNSAD